jgi:Spy/CpxP family protein refolding chaperone
MSTPRKRLAVLALIGGVAIAAGIGAVAHEPGAAFAFHHHPAMSAEEISTHVDKFLQHVYVEIDATDAQKAQIDPLVRQAVTDLMPMHSQARDFHTQALALLSADRIDRAAIETMRAEHIQAADQASRRIAQVIADVAEVLTPAQRKALAARAAEMHGLN